MSNEEKIDYSSWSSQDLATLHSWLYCVCIVEFDLSEGQTLKFSYPIDILSDGVESPNQTILLAIIMSQYLLK